jgi:hypothetical protein
MTDVEKTKQLLEVNEVVKRILADFVDKEITPILVAEAEGRVRQALVDMILKGDYVLPDGLELDRVALGANRKIQVFFRRTLPL